MATSNYDTALNTQDYTKAAPATPTGLINTQATLQTPASTYSGAQATAADWEVKPNQTVQSQIKDIIAENSPLMEQAETRSLQKANARGLMNSSIAVGAGQSALYEAAAPIAAADAATYARAGEFNAGAQQQTNLSNQASTNTSEQFNASSTNQVNSQNSQLQTNVALNNAALNTDIAKFNASESNALTKLGMDAQTKTELAQIEASYKTLMQTSASASDMYKQYILNTATILQNKDMNADAKTQAIRNQVSGLNNGLEMMGKINNLGLGNLLTFDGLGSSPAPAPGAAPASAPAPAPAPSAAPAPAPTSYMDGVPAEYQVSYQGWRDLMQRQYGVSDPAQLSYDNFVANYGGGPRIDYGGGA